MKNKVAGIRFLAVASVLLCSMTLAFAQATVDVSMTDSLVFAPQEVTVNAGDTVVWTNTGAEFPHTATADSFRDRRAGFNSGSLPRNWLQPGDTFEFTFTTEGTYPYHCNLHDNQGMLGTVNVSSPTAASSKHPFTAVPVADAEQILVQWTVPRSTDRVGFKVLRSTGWDKEFVQVNEGVITAEAQTADGEDYRFVDASAAGNTRYFYVLEEVRLDGRDAFRGPAISSPL